ncbi:MAG TPA: gamma-glutamylcyclotransferase family protein [Solirubrobacterales bacterium]|nr:gamma-glutamylcyclotransferase family protein [Solirubrobacterales bacterium]
MTRIAVFGYGSLVDPASASATLGRKVDEVVPARLRGWRRRFSQARDNATCEKTFARADDGTIPAWILGLNVERNADAEEAPNGGLIAVTEAELARLDVREIRYDRVEVTAEIEPSGAGDRNRFDRVITYVAKPGHLAIEPPDGAVILRRYAEATEAAFELFGPAAADEYRRTTLPYPAEVIDGVLVRDRIPEGNPREW